MHLSNKHIPMVRIAVYIVLFLDLSLKVYRKSGEKPFMFMYAVA